MSTLKTIKKVGKGLKKGVNETSRFFGGKRMKIKKSEDIQTEINDISNQFHLGLALAVEVEKAAKKYKWENLKKEARKYKDKTKSLYKIIEKNKVTAKTISKVDTSNPLNKIDPTAEQIDNATHTTNQTDASENIKNAYTKQMQAALAFYKKTLEETKAMIATATTIFNAINRDISSVNNSKAIADALTSADSDAKNFKLPKIQPSAPNI